MSSTFVDIPHSAFLFAQQRSFAPWALLVGLIGSNLLALSIYRLLLHPLRNLPGPPLAKVTRLWHSWRYLRGSWHDDILKLHEKYGPVVRIAPNEVSFVDGQALKKVYSYAGACPKVS